MLWSLIGMIVRCYRRYGSRVVLRLSQCRHDIHPLSLASELLHCWIVEPHEHVVLLLVSNREFALGLLVGICERFKLLDRVGLQHLDAELHVALRILMPWEDFGVIRESSKGLVQCSIHLLRCAFEESSTTANEQSVAGEYGSVVAVFEQIADAVLCMTRSMQSLNCDALSYSEGLAMTRSLGDLITVLAADDGELVGFQDLLVAASVIMMATKRSGFESTCAMPSLLMCVDYVRQLNSSIDGLLERWQNSACVSVLCSA